MLAPPKTRRLQEFRGVQKSLFEEEGGGGASSSSKNAVDTEAIAACAGVEIEGAEGQELTLERHDNVSVH